jgi:hypothetical protein
MNRLMTCAAIGVLACAIALVSGSACAQQERASPRPQPAVGAGIADLPVWKRVTLGSYRGVNVLRKALDAARVRVGDSADEIIGRPAFHFSPNRTDVDLVLVRVSDLGFDDAARVADIHRRAGELGLELCPAEVAPLLRLAYLDQPVGEFLNVAMHPIAAYGGDPVALSVANAGTGPLLLGGEGRPDLLMNWRAQFVFVRPARIASPNVR